MSLRIASDRRRGERASRLLASCALLAATFLSSCSAKEGWAVVLWPPEGSAIPYGAVVPVHFKSSITKTYAVGVPGSRAKEELDLWRVEPYRTKYKASAAAAGYGELAALMGVSARDGLLLRTKPDNVSPQVYRLKLGQAVRLLRKTPGAVVETGGEALPGDWYLALADDGTSGYVFSNQLMLWDSNSADRPDLGAGEQANDAALASLYDTVWRPEYFDRMVASGLLDLAAYQPRFGVFSDPLRKQLRVERPDFSKVYRYELITAREDGSYEIAPTGASFYFSQAGSLVFSPPAADIPAAALDRAREAGGEDAIVTYEFVKHGADVQAVVAAEERRRLARLSDFVANGERYESEAYGVLIITRSTRFTWVAYGALSPAVIPEGSGETGSVAMDLYLSPELATEWQGAFSLRFDGDRPPAISFAYRLEGDDLILAHLPPEATANAVVTAPDGLAPTATFRRYR